MSKPIKPLGSRQRARTPLQSFIFYNGPSAIDGAPVIGVFIRASRNSKTGNVSQTYILHRDTDPITANRTGADSAICGACIHRGKGSPELETSKGNAPGRSCYVNLGQGPLQVFKAYKRGNYPEVFHPAEIQAQVYGAFIRMGTYGDPAAIPRQVWDALLANSSGHTGYTHQQATAAAFADCMQSADTPEQAQQAHQQGFRTFRVIPLMQWREHGKASILDSEILCPASTEAREEREQKGIYKDITCSACKLCDGTDSLHAKSIIIPAHGAPARNFKGVSSFDEAEG